TTVSIAAPPEAIGVAPPANSTQGASYSITGELLSNDGESQLFLYLHDNETENLVVSDMQIFTDTAGLAEFLPFLIDSLLDRIPKYDITLKVATGGAIQVDETTAVEAPVEETTDEEAGDEEGSQEEATVTVRHQGAGSFDINAVAAEGFEFEKWEITFLDSGGDEKTEELTDNPYKVELSTENQSPGPAGPNDQFATIVPITIEALFKAIAPPPPVEPVEPAEATEDVRQFKLSLAYAPEYAFQKNPEDHFSGFILLGADFAFDWLPFQGKWGAVGFGLDAFWFRIQGETDWYTAYSDAVNLALKINYELPQFRNFITLGLGIGGGASYSFSPVYKNKAEPMELPNVEPGWTVFLTGGLVAEMYFLPWLYLKLGADYNIHYPFDNFGFISIKGGIGLKF
ncbi:MAG: hypothetical protein LBM77_12010, partial [Spirochaetaceae bacterium]|nr:hypothetical protein [Spirochaetaceae bacterium]